MANTYPPNCARPGCGHPQATHNPAMGGAHECQDQATGIHCEAMVFPPDVSPYFPLLPNCPATGCGHSPELHELTAPHACKQGGCSCNAYDFSGSGRAEGSFEGGGGGFGGGGASGGW